MPHLFKIPCVQKVPTPVLFFFIIGKSRFALVKFDVTFFKYQNLQPDLPTLVCDVIKKS